MDTEETSADERIAAKIELGELRGFRERYLADVAGLASVRLEGQEPDFFSHQITAWVIEGELSIKEAIELGRQHYGQSTANP